MKPIIWTGNSKTNLRAFYEDAWRQAGFELTKVQKGKHLRIGSPWAASALRCSKFEFMQRMNIA